MMDYLKNYNINDEQIRNLEKVIRSESSNIDLFMFEPEIITNILDLFTSIGVTNIYGIIMTCPSMFCDTIESIKKRIDKYEDKTELARLLNDDPSNLILIGIA